MKNNTNHTIATLFNELTSGRSIDLDYNNRSYTFTRQNDNEMLVYFSNGLGSEIMGHFRVEPNRKDVTFIFWDLSKETDPEYPITDLEQLDGLGIYLQFDTIVNEANE